MHLHFQMFFFQGIFKGDEDLNLFDEDFRMNFQKSNVDFSDDGWDYK